MRPATAVSTSVLVCARMCVHACVCRDTRVQGWEEGDRDLP